MHRDSQLFSRSIVARLCRITSRIRRLSAIASDAGVHRDLATERRCTKVERSVHMPLQPFELEDDMAKKATTIEKAMSKSVILTELADRTELSRKQVGR